MEGEQPHHCYVNFKIRDEAALRRLTAVVEEFKRQKVSAIALDGEHWLQFFQGSDRDEFWWPDDAEAKRWDQFWFSIPLPLRLSPTMPHPPWHLGSMVENILEGDYDLIRSCNRGDKQGRLEFEPHSYPYGGTGALRALVRAFGHEITGYDDGTGFVAGDAQAPRWTRDTKALSHIWHRIWSRG